MKGRKLQKFLVVFVVLCGAVLSIYVASILRRPRARELFQFYVIDPVPASVVHIKVDQPKTGGGYGYVFRFAINRTDLELIRQSRPFRPAQITNYMKGGSLWWDWKDVPASGHIGEKGRAFTIYGIRAAPSWYDLESWGNQETHISVKKGKDGNTSDIQVLTYNAELGCAFFIVFHYRGTVPFF